MTIKIIDEIAKIKNDSGHIKATIEKLEIQQKETKKQLYLFKVLNLVQEFEVMIKNKSFENADICTADLHISVEEDIGNVIKLSPYDSYNLYVDDCFYDKENGLVSIQEVIVINNLFSTLDGLIREHVSEELKNNKVYKMNIEEGCSKVILDALLSKELKSLLEYSEMYHELSNENEPKAKKAKM